MGPRTGGELGEAGVGARPHDTHVPELSQCRESRRKVLAFLPPRIPAASHLGGGGGSGLAVLSRPP